MGELFIGRSNRSHCTFGLTVAFQSGFIGLFGEAKGVKESKRGDRTRKITGRELKHKMWRMGRM